MSRILRRLGLTSLSLIAGAMVVQAQTTTTGAVNGSILDSKTGTPIADAVVRLESGQVSRTTRTGADGRYSAGLLNAGAWTVSVSKGGYSTSKQSVQVSINTATTANFKVAPEGGATVEVVAATSIIDATSTTTGSNFSADTVAMIPKGREFADMAFMAPGVTTSGFGSNNGNAGLGLEISIAGASGAENSFSVDGLKTNDMRYGGQSVAMSNEFIDQVDIQTGGYKPEYSAMGGVFNVLTKSGGNEFGGSTWATYTPRALSPDPKGTPWFRELPASSVMDVGAWVGGAFIKDKFFYSIGLNYAYTNSPSYNNFSSLPVGGTKTPTYQFMGKFQYFLNTDNQLTLSYFGNNRTATQEHGNAPTNLFDGRGTADTSGDTKNNSNNFNFIWDSNLTSNLNLSVKAGQAHLLNQVTPNVSTPLIRDRTYYAEGGPGFGEADPLTYWAAGGSGNISKETNTTTQFTADLSWAVSSHNLKFGYSYLRSNYADETHRNGGMTWMLQYYVNPNNLNNYLRATQNLYDNNSEANAYFQAIYAQDTWQIDKDFNLFYGFRAEDQKQIGATGQTFMHFKFSDYVQPRLGFTWDPIGKGMTKVSGSYAWYYMQIPQRMAIRTYGKEYYHLLYYGGAQTPGNTTNKSTLPSSTATYNRATNQVTVTGSPYMDIDYSTGWSQDPIADGTKLPKRTEILLGIDHQLNANHSIGLHLHYRKLTDPIEDSEITEVDGTPIDSADKVGQAIIWNPNSGPVTWTSPFSGQKVTAANTLYPEAYNEYKAADISYTYKTSDAFFFLGYTWSRDYGTYEGLISATNGQPDGGITASFDYWPYVGTGYLPTDHTHQIKAYGYKKFKVGTGDLSLGFNFLAQSGRPYSQQDDGSTTPAYQVPDPDHPDSTMNIGDPGQYLNATFQNGLLGNKGRLPWTTRLDLTAHYEIPLNKKMKLEPLIEIYNVMNHRPETAVLEQYLDRYGNPQPAGRYASATNYQAGRSFRFGAKLRF